MTSPEPSNPPTLDPRGGPPIPQVPLTVPDYPKTNDEATSTLATLQAKKGPALTLLNQYTAEHPGLVLHNGQLGYMQSDGGYTVSTDPATLGQEIPNPAKFVPDQQATYLQQNFNQLDDTIKQIQSDQKAKLLGPTNTAMSYVDSEQMKQDEAKKEFVDAMTRIKALYDFNEQQQTASLNNQKANVQRKEDVFSGAPGGLIRPLYDPRQAQLSQMMRGALPSSIPPYYSMSEAVGLPGKEGLGGGISYTPSSYGAGLSGYAAGTGNGPGGIDPEIAWMIGKPDVPVVLDPSKVPPLPPTAPGQMRGRR